MMILRKNLKLFTESVVVLSLFIVWLTTVPDNSFAANMSTFACCAVWAGMFVTTSKISVPRYLLRRKIGTFLLCSILVLLVSVLVLSFFRIVHLAEMYYRRYYIDSKMLDYIYNFEWRHFAQLVLGVAGVWLGSTLYGVLTTIRYPNNTIFRKILPRTLSGLAIVGSLLFIAFVVNETLSFRQAESPYVQSNANNEIIFREDMSEVSDLSNLLDEIDIQSQPICILFWAPSCGSQLSYVKELDAMRRQVGGPDIQYLYVCGEYEDKYSWWKESVETESIEGTHMYLPRKEFHDILIEDLGVHSGVAHVVVLDRTHQQTLISASFSNSLPKNKEKLIGALSQL